MLIVLKGLLKKKMPTKKITDTLSVLDFILLIDEDSQYPQKVLITATNDNISLLNAIPEGRLVEAKVYLRGKEKESGMVFNQFSLSQIKPVAE